MTRPLESPTHLPPCHCAELRDWAQWNSTTRPWSLLEQRLCHVKRKTLIIEPFEKLNRWADAGCHTCRFLAKAIDHVMLDERQCQSTLAPCQIKLHLCNFAPQLKVTVFLENEHKARQARRRGDVKAPEEKLWFFMAHSNGKSINLTTMRGHCLPRQITKVISPSA